MTIVLLTLLLLPIPSVNQKVIGTYVMIDRKGLEQHSTLTLKNNYDFIYSYGVGGCQGEVKGKWSINDNQLLEFKSEIDFNSSSSSNLTPCYPDLNSGHWKVTKRGLVLQKVMDCACWKVKGLHQKVNK
ncbi:hypothetical protein [Flammeovirga aprica]|uniref:Uncharacterized protein n=1 Tax=Flammeovirga aprica JL-4 TaxID=694437 RepID=A0A7X9S250_9BACT|nr:hypothetical protein [Flammeovirga aprica]NME72968.1 hypothetical protein [Flammeovirga aprica JL-4]